MYLYSTTIYRDTNDVIGINVVQNDLDKTDFETNYKSQAVLVGEIFLAETTFVLEITYASFKSKIDGVNILWSDVKYQETAKHYTLNILIS